MRDLPIPIMAAVFQCKCKNISATALAIDGNDGESLMIDDKSRSFKSLWNISYRYLRSSQILTRWYLRSYIFSRFFFLRSVRLKSLDTVRGIFLYTQYLWILQILYTYFYFNFLIYVYTFIFTERMTFFISIHFICVSNELFCIYFS